MRDLIDLRPGTRWQIVNDGVMGGRSQSQIRVERGRAIFSGTLSPENGGGFASVRADLDLGRARDMTAVALRVRGDGKRYQFRIRTGERWGGPAYRAELDTRADEWVEVVLPLSAFELSFRGRLIADAPPIDVDEIQQVGLLVASEQWGPFRLEVDWIRAVTD